MRIAKLALVAGATGLFLTARLAYAGVSGSDIEGTFSRTKESNENLCPAKIEHTTFATVGDRMWGLPHNTIVHDGSRCNSVADERSFVLYENSLLAENNPRVPQELVALLALDGHLIDAKYALDGSKERYYIGYEFVGRFCQDGSKFENGTVSFIFRPFWNVNMHVNKSTVVQFAPGKRYMLMVPRYSQTVCIYSANIPGADDEASDGEANSSSEPMLAPHMGGEEEEEEEERDDDDYGDPTPSVEATTEDEVEENPGCFPAHSLVELKNGTVREMHKLEIGDLVRTGTSTFSTVFMFTHRIGYGNYSFIRIETSKGSILSLTPGHYIYVNSGLSAAKAVKVGDVVHGRNGGEIVQAVSFTKEGGLFNPQTVDGDIMVNGIRASTYTQTVAPMTAHALLAPVRILHSLFGFATKVLETGVGHIAQLAPRGVSVYSNL